MNHDEVEQTNRDGMADAIRHSPKRPRLTVLEQVRKIVETKQFARVNGVLVDGTTASIICKVHEALNDENKAKFEALPIRKMGIVALKLFSGKGR